MMDYITVPIRARIGVEPWKIGRLETYYSIFADNSVNYSTLFDRPVLVR
jgi:hypothetical protein